MKNRFLLTLASLFAFWLVGPQQGYAQTPDVVIAIQGTLKDANGASVADGERQVTFRLYSVAEGGTALWEEVALVTVVGGIYSHNLGSVTPLVGGNFDQTVYLGVTVGSLELSPRTQMTYAPYALAVNSAQKIAQGGCSGQVGDIKYSILNPTQFAMENGDCWVPMDGRAIPGTRLATDYGMAMVPDMSGLFIRATEFDGGADNDPGRGPLASATMQGDDNKDHSHTYSGTTDPAGRHSHSVTQYVWRRSFNGEDGTDAERTMVKGPSGTSISSTSYNTSTQPDHTHTYSGTTNPNGDAEARPKNMNFFIYIRVN